MNDPDQIVVGANGSIAVAPVGTTAPTTPTAEIPAAAVDLGYADEDGLTFTDGKTLEPINVWQSFYPARQIVTEKESSVAFNLAQWNRDTVPLAFGGGSVTEPESGVYRFEPPEPGTIDERMAICTWVDGSRNYRLIVPRCIVSENVETNLTKSAAGLLPITLGVLGSEGVAPWYLLTDDPAFAPAGSS